MHTHTHTHAHTHVPQAQHGLCDTQPVPPVPLLPRTRGQRGGEECGGAEVLRQQGVQLPAVSGGAAAIGETGGQVPTENDPAHRHETAGMRYCMTVSAVWLAQFRTQGAHARQ